MLNELALQNPWWNNKQAIFQDIHLRQAEKSPFDYKPGVISKKDLRQTGVMTLRGSRQIGKTTYLKMLVRDLLEDHFPAENILFYNAELVANDRELFNVVREFLEISDNGKKYIFLDEITFVPRWEYAIKHIVDLGLGTEVLFILSGSSAIDLRKGGERLPGRRKISRPDRVLLPLNFRRFCELNGVKITDSLDFSHWRESIDKALPALKRSTAVLQKHFDRYLISGGFPPAITDAIKNGAVSPETIETYRSVVISDFEKLRKDRIILRNLCRRIIANLAAPVSWNNLAKQAGAISVNTVKEYIQMLADSFLLYILPFLDKGRFQPRPNKNRKYYPFDPILYRVLAQLANMRDDAFEQSMKIEGIVGETLMRTSERQLFEGFSNLDSLFYWRSKRDREVDFVVLWNGREIPVEVKQQTVISPIDYTTIKRSFGEGVVVTKDKFFQDNGVVGLPAACFLYLLPDRANTPVF